MCIDFTISSLKFIYVYKSGIRLYLHRDFIL